MVPLKKDIGKCKFISYDKPPLNINRWDTEQKKKKKNQEINQFLNKSKYQNKSITQSNSETPKSEKLPKCFELGQKIIKNID